MNGANVVGKDNVLNGVFGMPHINVQEKLFLHQEQKDFKYVVHHLYDGDTNTGIIKLTIRRGPRGVPEVVKYCLHGAVYDSVEDATQELKKSGVVKMNWRKKDR